MAKLFSLHDITVYPDGKAEAFEAFIQQMMPLQSPWPGIRSYAVKGDRGDRLGRYFYIMDVESVETYYRYFPTVDDGTAPFETQELFIAMENFIVEFQMYALFPGHMIPYTAYATIGEF